MIASHDPANQFHRRKDYPAIAWAAKNCGKKATSDTAVEKAAKKLESKKLKDEGAMLKIFFTDVFPTRLMA